MLPRSEAGVAACLHSSWWPWAMSVSWYLLPRAVDALGGIEGPRIVHRRGVEVARVARRILLDNRRGRVARRVARVGGHRVVGGVAWPVTVPAVRRVVR